MTLGSSNGSTLVLELSLPANPPAAKTPLLFLPPPAWNKVEEEQVETRSRYKTCDGHRGPVSAEQPRKGALK